MLNQHLHIWSDYWADEFLKAKSKDKKEPTQPVVVEKKHNRMKK